MASSRWLCYRLLDGMVLVRMLTRKAYQVGYFDGIEGFDPRPIKDGMISVSENVEFVYPHEIQKYEQGYEHGRKVRRMISVIDSLERYAS